MRIRRPFLLSLLVGPALAGLVAQADTTPSRALAFVDQRSGLTLTVQVDQRPADAGHFVFRVPGLGHYVGEAGAGIRANSDRNVVIKYTGPASLRPEVSADGVITGSVRSPRPVTVDLQAQLDPVNASAQAILRDGRDQYHLVALRPSTAALERTLTAIERAFTSDDPVALYPHMSLQTRTTYAVDDFARTWRAQSSSIGRVTAMTRLQISEPHTNEIGLTFVTATYDVTRMTPAGASETKRFDVLFLYEDGEWRLLLTRMR